MSLRGEDALIAAMDYTKQSLEGAGALKGEKGDKGEDGISPIATVSKTDNVTNVSISDKFGTTEAEILDGKDGVSPTVVIGGNGNWFINGEDTGVSAKGLQGETGKGFQITKQYSNIDEMVSDTEPANDSEIVVVIDGEVGNFYLRLTGYIDPEGITDNYLPIGSATEISSVKGEKGDDGITPRIDPITKRWFIGEVDTGILAEGKDGDSPTIGENGNWFIGGIDSGIVAKGKDGRSILSITKDDNENIIVTYSDGTTENIGKLEVDVQADFLTSSGFGKLRFYENKFQYYNEDLTEWVDVEATADNPLIVDLAPQPMQKMFVTFNVDENAYKLTFKEPKDTVVNGQMLVCVEGIKFVRKLGSEPIDENDGTLVLDYKRRYFSNYNHTSYLDKDLDATNGEHWYYKAFPYSTNGIIANSSANVASAICKDYYLYGFKLDQNESDPASMITYLEDCDNAYYESAYMDYNADIFRYGDWEDAWFIRDLKPVMLKYDGTVDYELARHDYALKKDGTTSDVTNTSYEGNAMIGFPKVYWKIIDNGNDTANIYFSNKKVDDDFVCWSHIDNNGNEIDYCYMPIYNGYYDGTRLRSISGQAPMYGNIASVDIDYALANNISENTIWYIEVFSDRMLVNLLLILIGKSTDTQTVFGTGNNNSYISTSNTGIKNSGTMDNRGLFWGNQDNVSGVKIFGIENWWGNQWRRFAGWVKNKTTNKIKLTYSQIDGSTVNGYNITGDGYITLNNYVVTGTSSGYINKMTVKQNFLMPSTTDGSSSSYYTDGLWFNNNAVSYAAGGGSSSDDLRCGAFATVVNTDVSIALSWNTGASVSCKPLATT